ncbi:MAG: putative transposase [Cryptosporangiaceae bacterium]|nr:putative transposase [Cryptosporangiaceae bacterium]
MIAGYVDQRKQRFGVEPICAVLADAGAPITPSTYYAAKRRAPSARSVRDEVVTERIEKVHAENYGVYGIRQIHAQLARDGGVDGAPVARCTVARLMRDAGLRGIGRSKSPRTTVPGGDTAGDSHGCRVHPAGGPGKGLAAVSHVQDRGPRCCRRRGMLAELGAHRVMDTGTLPR